MLIVELERCDQSWDGKRRFVGHLPQVNSRDGAQEDCHFLKVAFALGRTSRVASTYAFRSCLNVSYLSSRSHCVGIARNNEVSSLRISHSDSQSDKFSYCSSDKSSWDGMVSINAWSQAMNATYIHIGKFSPPADWAKTTALLTRTNAEQIYSSQQEVVQNTYFLAFY